ncbi:hypothetical protein STEG23_022805 [Scotinomys teguina]
MDRTTQKDLICTVIAFHVGIVFLDAAEKKSQQSRKPVPFHLMGLFIAGAQQKSGGTYVTCFINAKWGGSSGAIGNIPSYDELQFCKSYDINLQFASLSSDYGLLCG